MNYRQLLKKYMKLVITKEDLNWSYLSPEYDEPGEWAEENGMWAFFSKDEFNELKIIEKKAGAETGFARYDLPKKGSA